ncbi:MAG TPA: hypothetical protein VEA99_01430 [Gemmatimonadaceae bacterium]|nr:hypothetical protein [Gemmatimonadaceae bacterium]
MANRRTAPLASALLLTFALAACQEPSTQPAATPLQAGSTLALEATDGFAPDRGAIASLDELFDVRSVDARAINPSDYVCTNTSSVSAWLNAEVGKTVSAELARIQLAVGYLADLIPTYEALYFQSSAVTPQHYGVNGQFTHAIEKTDRDMKRFWAINSANIDVVAMHGNVLVDTIRTARTYRLLLGVSAPQAAIYARTLRSAFVGSTTMVDGNHPYFTFNAVAQLRVAGTDSVKKIVMGDGILQAYEALGFGDVAPQAIFAHEFAHHVQFEKAIRLTGAGITAAERTRFGELSADAMAAYYLTHARGLAMNKHRVAEFLQIFLEIGDCSFTSSGHHGTPNQRMAAARFGFDVADQARPQGHILSPAAFHALFLAKWPELIAPDAD